MLNTNLFLKLTRVEKEYGVLKRLDIRPKVKCADGFEISIQASELHYCDPKNNYSDTYKEVELGFPSEKEDLIASYAEDYGDYTDTVYPYVPVELVDKVLEKHGGIVDITKHRNY